MRCLLQIVDTILSPLCHLQPLRLDSRRSHLLRLVKFAVSTPLWITQRVRKGIRFTLPPGARRILSSKLGLLLDFSTMQTDWD